MSKGMEVFSEKVDLGLQDRVYSMWEFVEGFPLPKFELTCGCGSTIIKNMSFTYCRKDDRHVTQVGGTQTACAMMFRCWTCGGLSEYTAAVPQEIYDLRSDKGNPALYHWEKALAIIEAAGALTKGGVNAGDEE